MITAKILAFAGCCQDSFNKKLKIAVEGVKAAGADATYLDFRDLPLPLYDAVWRRLRGCQRMPSSSRPDESASGIPHACPEYNSSITPLLKMRSIGHRVLNGEPHWCVSKKRLRC